jgi:hypothetical protein
MKMKRSFKIITIVALFLSLILISSCSTENHKEEDVREANTQLKLESEELNGITIELLLREFANWAVRLNSTGETLNGNYIKRSN